MTHEDLKVDLNIDPWGYGKNPNGKLDLKYLIASYPFIKINDSDEWAKISLVLKNHIENNEHGLRPYLTWPYRYIFFQRKEDAQLAETLRLIY